MATWKPTQPSTWRPVSEELIKEGLELILNRDTHPVLIMCTYVHCYCVDCCGISSL